MCFLKSTTNMAAPSKKMPFVQNILNDLSSQFLEMVPVRKMKWKNEQTATLVAAPDVQLEVLRVTVNHPVCRIYPPSLSYRRHFMKQLIQRLEEFEAEICDEVYETYTDLLAQKEEEDDTLCFKTYSMDGGEQISLQESVHLVSQGTTGLSTWQAAQHLVEWIQENPDLVADKNIVELGCGLGLTGIMVCRQCAEKLKSYIFSDCHPQVLYLLSRNIQQNLAHCAQKTNLGSNRDRSIMRKIRRQLSLTTDTGGGDGEGGLSLESCDVTSPEAPPEVTSFDDDEIQLDIEDLELDVKYWKMDDTRLMGRLKKDERIGLAKIDWQCLDDNLMQKVKPDVVLAADVIYDIAIIPALVSLLQRLLSNTSSDVSPVAYISSTVRNEDTRDNFLIALGSEGLAYTILDPPKNQIFHYDRSVPIEILKICLLKK